MQSIALDPSVDTLIEESGRSTKNEEISVTQTATEAVHNEVEDTGHAIRRLPEVASFLVGEVQTDTAGSNNDHPAYAGNVVLSPIGTAIHVRGSGNTFHITP